MSTSVPYNEKLASEGVLFGSINALSFSTNGTLLAAADSVGCLLVINVSWGTAVHLGYFGPHSQVYSLAWASDTELFFGCSNGVVASLKYAQGNGEYRVMIGSAIMEAMPSAVTCLAYKAGRHSALAIAYGSQAEVWRKHRGKWSQDQVYAGDTSADQVASATFLENGDLLVGYFGSGISIWSADTARRIYVPGLRSQSINSFVYSLDGLLFVAFDPSTPDGPFTNLYRFAAQPPYGLTEVKNWPGLNWDTSSTPLPISICGHSGSHLVACAMTAQKVIIVEAHGLAGQFTPSLPAQCDGDVLIHSQAQVLATTTYFDRNQSWIATASILEDKNIRLQIWSTELAEAEAVQRAVKQDNIPEMLWDHIEKRGQSTRVGSVTKIIVLLFAVLLASHWVYPVTLDTALLDSSLGSVITMARQWVKQPGVMAKPIGAQLHSTFCDSFSYVSWVAKFCVLPEQASAVEVSMPYVQLQIEADRATKLEDSLEEKTSEFQREQLIRRNLETSLESAQTKQAATEKSLKQIQLELENYSLHNSGTSSQLAAVTKERDALQGRLRELEASQQRSVTKLESELEDLRCPIPEAIPGI